MRAARGLLSAVTRLLILADIIDVNLMLKKLQQVENDLENLKNANSQAELMDSMGRFTHSAQELMAQAAKRSVNLTLDSGINIGLRLLIFGFFSRGYVPYLLQIFFKISSI